MSVISVKIVTFNAAGRDFSICYRLHISDLANGSRCYGVSVDNDRTGEVSWIRDLTSSREQAERFFLRIIKGRVTPLHLHDLAEDFVTWNSL